MTQSKRETSENICRHGSPKAYSPPKIREFGSIGTLTQAGTAGVQEGMAMTNMMRMI